MSQDLPIIANDFNAVCAISGAKRVKVRKKSLHPVRDAAIGEVAQTGEIAKENYVAILPENATNTDRKPLYFMRSKEFLEKSEHQYTEGELNYWLVEYKPTEAVIIPQSHGPFHLQAPQEWEGHEGWHVTEAFTFKTPQVLRMVGYLLTRAEDGVFFDDAALQRGKYEILDWNPA